MMALFEILPPQEKLRRMKPKGLGWIKVTRGTKATMDTSSDWVKCWAPGDPPEIKLLKAHNVNWDGGHWRYYRVELSP